jgi:acyl carrier protein
MSDPVSAQILARLSAALHRPLEGVTPETSLAELGLDSLDMITAMFELEDQFGISIPDEQFRTLATVGDVTEAIRKLVAAQARHE